MKGKPLKCRLLVTRAGHTAHYDADLIFTNGHPHAVFEWSEPPPPAERTPAVTVALEARYLHPLQGWGQVTHMYEMPISDPRPLQ